MIRLRDVAYSYDTDYALRDISFDINKGELLGLIGPSGSGKTTLLRLLLGELVPSRGVIQVASARAPRIGYVPQLEAAERNFPLTVEEMVMLGGAAFSRRRPWFDNQERRRAQAILERLEIRHLRTRRLNELSGGQFQRALFARALMAKPELLILDEPTSGIDLATRLQILNLVFDLQEEGFTVVISTHDLNWVASHLPRIVCLHTVITADGHPSEILTPSVVRQTYGADMEVLHHNGRPVVVDTAQTAGKQ